MTYFFIKAISTKTKCISAIYNKGKPWSQDWLIAASAYPGFRSMKWLEEFLLSLDGMLVLQFVRFPQQFAGTHLYTWVDRGTVRVKCLAQEHNTMSPARARTRSARSGIELTNHEATEPSNICANRNKNAAQIVLLMHHK